MALASHPDPVRSKLETDPRTGGRSLADRVFDGLFTNWQLMTRGCIHVATPKGTPVYAGSLSEVVSAVAGAATRGLCPRGTGWPPGGTR